MSEFATFKHGGGEPEGLRCGGDACISNAPIFVGNPEFKRVLNVYKRYNGGDLLVWISAQKSI